MKVLAIDTAANLCAACVFDTGPEHAPVSATVDIGKGHVEQLMPLIGQVLSEAGIDYPDIDRIAVSVGPGSFTGVRVGVAAARGFSLALGIPAVGISTLDAIAAETRQNFPGLPALVALDARRGEVYAASYDASGQVVADARITTVSALAAQMKSGRHVLAGSAAHAVAAVARGEAVFDFGSTSATAGIAVFARLGAQSGVPDEAPKPLYLRAPDAKPQTGFAVARAGR